MKATNTVNRFESSAPSTTSSKLDYSHIGTTTSFFFLFFFSIRYKRHESLQKKRQRHPHSEGGGEDLVVGLAAALLLLLPPDLLHLPVVVEGVRPEALAVEPLAARAIGRALRQPRAVRVALHAAVKRLKKKRYCMLESWYMYPTNNAPLINFRLSSDAKSLLISTI